MTARSCLAVLALAAASCAAPRAPLSTQQTAPSERADPRSSIGARDANLRVQLHYGQLEFDDARAGDNREPEAVALTLSHVPADRIVGLELGLNVAWDNVGIEDALLGETEYSACEFFAGARAQYDAYRVKPYVAAGGTLLYANRTESLGLGGERSEDSLSVHPYIRAGALLRVGDGFHVGIELRHVVGGELDFGADAFDADNEQLTFGIAFDV